MNDSKQFIPAYTIGDVIFCRNLRLQRYRDFPQLVGNYEKSTILTFRNKSQTIMELGTNSQQTNLQEQISLRKEDWDFKSYTNIRATVKDVDSDLSAAVIRLSNWAHEFFRSHTMSDAATFPHSNLHTLLHHHNIFQRKTDAYSLMFPPNFQSIPAPMIGGTAGADLAKVDVVGLVVSNIKGTDNSPTRILLWDGTGNGYYPTIPGAARHISIIDRALLQSAPDATEVWKSFEQRSKSLSTSSTTASEIQASIPWDKEMFLGNFLVVESRDMPQQNIQQEFLTNFQPGRWIRLRNITVDNTRTDFGVPVAEVRTDAHVSFLQPYFRDVRTLVGNYFSRVNQHLTILIKQEEDRRKLEEHHQQQQIQRATQQRAQQQQLIQHRSEHGHAPIALAWILAFPVQPVDKIAIEFFCSGKLLSWFPNDTSK